MDRDVRNLFPGIAVAVLIMHRHADALDDVGKMRTVLKTGTWRRWGIMNAKAVRCRWSLEKRCVGVWGAVVFALEFDHRTTRKCMNLP